MAKLPYRWSHEAPRQAGYWWHRESDDDDSPRIVRVYRDAGGEWSVTYGDLGQEPDEEDDRCDFVENWLHDGQAMWCYIPSPSEHR